MEDHNLGGASLSTVDPETNNGAQVSSWNVDSNVDLTARNPRTCREHVMSNPAPAGFRLLIVDDDDQLRQTLVRWFRRKGLTVTGASGGEETLAQAGQNRWDGALIDLNMLGMNGIELAKRLTELYPGVKLLFLSGYAGVVNGPDRLVTQGNFLPKPFSLGAFASKVRQVLESDRSGSFV